MASEKLDDMPQPETGTTFRKAAYAAPRRAIAAMDICDGAEQSGGSRAATFLAAAMPRMRPTAARLAWQRHVPGIRLTR